MLDTLRTNRFQANIEEILADLDTRIKASPGDPSHRVLKALLTIELELARERDADQMRKASPDLIRGLTAARRIAAEHFEVSVSPPVEHRHVA
jgi:hypothetical protein